jgi:MoxR-like ATPase
MDPSNPSAVSPASLAEVQRQIERVFVGKEEVVRNALACLLAGGHLLIEDVPGVGKTTLALALAKAAGCSFQRIQFTSDMMPSDILGVSVFDAKTQEFEFRHGPIFHQVVLADELNRATPRTQSALLESMNERQVTLDNRTMPLPNPFFVVATQNPHEHHGTFPLPESQLDRFMMRLSIGYPGTESEKTILSMGIDHETVRQMPASLTPAELLTWMDQVRRIHVAPVVDDSLLAIVQATRTASSVEVGVSPRGAIALRKAAQARALLDRRDHVVPDDIKSAAVPVLAHRLIFTPDQLSDLREQSEQMIQTLVQRTAVPL